MKLPSSIKRVIFLLCMLVLFNIHAEKKVALIIGNEVYPDDKFYNLRTCVNDANLMSNVLKTIGFQTIVANNCNKTDFSNALERFDNLTNNADVAVYFYSGHAKNIGGELYLVPSNMTFSNTAQRSQFISLSDVLDIMVNNSKLSLLFIDACRDGARTSVKGISKGERRTPDGSLPTATLPHGWMIFYATQNGEKATIGDGIVSPFTSALAKHLTDGNEFRTVWNYIKDDVTALAPGQFPDEEHFYENSFYFYPNGDKLSSPDQVITPDQNDNKLITINCNVPGAKVNFYGSTFDTGKPLSFVRDKEYTFTIDMPGYQKYAGVINVDKSPSTIDVTLIKMRPVDLYVKANTKADVYLDNDFVGQCIPGSSLLVETLSGKHELKLSAKGYYSYRENVDLVAGGNIKEFNLLRDYPDFWAWDSFNETHYVNYYFSPKYQLGLSYMYRPDESRWSFGATLAFSTSFIGGIDIQSYSYARQGKDITYTVEENGVPVTYRETTTFQAMKDGPYSDEIDPFHEATIKNSRALILGNVGFNICNGVQIEAGIGVGYHKPIYKMPYVAIKETTTITNVETGQIVGEPTIFYSKGDARLTYKGTPQWSPAGRLGAKFFIPLDGWDGKFITLGGGYIMLFTNFKQSSWDLNIGYVWSF